jgi:ABC-type Fe3+/spermidine/putrescine transport system ATPase subunit
LSDYDPAALLEIKGVHSSFRFRGAVTQALNGVTVDIGAGEFFVLLGPSGCGKTTMLRAIAGLQKPDSGFIRIGEQVVFSAQDRLFVPPERRPIAMVFQSYAVWPHMNVFENIAFPLREGVHRLGRAEIEVRVAEVLDLLGLAGVAERPVTMLSGGQQQRVALARALALRPKVLLMDEPLSNLDYNFQIRLRTELRELMRRLRLTTIYVTHNQSEAIEMGDRIAVMEAGNLVQVGDAREIYHFPHDEFVARFIGDMNLVPAVVETTEGGMATLRTEAGAFLARVPKTEARQGASYLLGIRPEDVVLVDPARESGTNLLHGTVARSRFSGEAIHCTVRAGGLALDLKLRRGADIETGATVTLRLPPEFCIAVESKAEAAASVGRREGARDAGRVPTGATGFVARTAKGGAV